MINRKLFLIGGIFLGLIASGINPASAVILPGPADINRIKPEQSNITPPAPAQGLSIPAAPLSTEPVPPNAKQIHFVLRGIIFSHVNVFTSAQLKTLYKSYRGKDVTLDIAWHIAANLTQMYRSQGYFLSQAFVPAQEVTRGILRIVAVEGYIGNVSLVGEDGTEKSAPHSSIINEIISEIKAARPARIQGLEHQLLLLNDLPGLSFQATLAPASAQKDDRSDAAVSMILTARKTTGITTLGVDNGGSRYLGPYELSASWSGSLLPQQRTDLSLQWVPVLGSRDGRLYTLNGTQKVAVSPTTSIDFTAGYANAIPGYTLKADDITSQSFNGGIGFNYDLIRQRETNLIARFSLDFRNSDSDILGSPLSRDRIRAANFSLNFSSSDSLSGRNFLDLEFRKGLPVFGSNSANDANASRPGTAPTFVKLQGTYNRLQGINEDFTGALTITGQKGSSSLYSSEEFGYGGMAIGRAYDTSEISGDSGIAGSVELRYQGLPALKQIAVTPYLFYDIGKVWNYNIGQPEQISAASAGSGISIQAPLGLSGNFFIAEPLTKPVATPLYGTGKSPRYVFQLSDKF